MSHYAPPLRDLRFVLHELLDLPEQMRTVGRDDLDAESIDQVLAGAGAFAAEVAAPLNASGDAQGCSMPEPGVVTTPAGFRDAYRKFAADGWTGLACDPEHGGQGLPDTINNAAFEMLCGANMGWSAYAGMSHAAYTCLKANGTAAQKSLYLPRIASGEWAGTMCLTEPHCGTDLGLLRTKAVPQDDGTYRITGTKIFISGGEQDFTDNIVHLVLARLPDAPAGVKGISLFVVPKFLPDADDATGERNAVVCGSIEEKLGLHGNSTCTMNFDGAIGWLLGEPNKGLAGMFVMMNHARLIVGVNAIGLMEAAYQRALVYAKDRAQGRSNSPARNGAPADPIVQHADVRRMLLTQKSYVEGCRAFAMWTTMLADQQHGQTDPDLRAETAALLALATPVVKSLSSDLAVESINLAVQCFGGHGYIRDTGIEQYLRDARIIPLYEGANGIQAMDLLGRKVLGDNGRSLGLLLREMRGFIERHRSTAEMQEFTAPLTELADSVEALTRSIAERAGRDADEVGAAAVPYLRLVGHLALAWMWARMAAVALSRHNASDETIYASKLATARFFYARLLPETKGLSAAIASGAGPLMKPELELL